MLRTHSPLRTNIAISPAFDLHVLSTPPAFILSQDQTLRRELHFYPIRRSVISQIKALPRHRSWPAASIYSRKNRHPPKLYSGVFPITAQLLRSVADGLTVRWHRVLPAPEQGLYYHCSVSMSIGTEKPMQTHTLFASVSQISRRSKRPPCIRISFGCTRFVHTRWTKLMTTLYIAFAACQVS